MKRNTLRLESLLIVEGALLHFCFIWLQPLKILKYFVEIGRNSSWKRYNQLKCGLKTTHTLVHLPLLILRRCQNSC